MLSARSRSRGFAPLTARKRSRGPSFDQPPQLKPEIRLSKIFRYQRTGVASGAAVPITAGDLLNIYVVALTATTTARLFRSVRLQKVEAWCPPTALGAAAQNQISIVGDGLGPENVASDIAMGVRPGHVVWRPPKKSQIELWFQSGEAEANAVFEINQSAPQGTIIDVTVEFIMADSFDGAVAGPVPAAATAGLVYVVPLDGNIGAGASLYTPVDYATLP
jgi:hypothetical protein